MFGLFKRVKELENRVKQLEILLMQIAKEQEETKDTPKTFKRREI